MKDKGLFSLIYLKKIVSSMSHYGNLIKGWLGSKMIIKTAIISKYFLVMYNLHNVIFKLKITSNHQGRRKVSNIGVANF